MKILSFVFALIMSASANAGEIHKVALEKYLYTGTLTGMTDALQEELAEKMLATCGKPVGIKVSELSISFKRGHLAGKGPLDAEVVKNDERLLVDFPGHPKAVLTAAFECL